MAMASVGQPVEQSPQPRQSGGSSGGRPSASARDGLEGAAQGAAAARRARVVVDGGDVPAARPDALGVQQRSPPGAGSSSRCSSCRWRCVSPALRPGQSVCVRPALSVSRRISTARSREISQPSPRSLSKRRQTSIGLVAPADDRAAVAGPQVDVLLGGDDGLRLGQQQIRVVDSRGVAGVRRTSDRLDVVADRGGVVVGRPVGEAAGGRQRDVPPALEHGADVEAVGEGGRRVGAGLVAVEHGATHGALEALRLDVGPTGPGRPPASSSSTSSPS